MSEYPTVHDNDISLLKKITTNTAEISDGGGVGGGSGTGTGTTYDPSTSGLTATDVQAAIDEAVVLIEARLESIEDTVADGQVVVFNGAGGKSGRKATGTGVAQMTDGVLGTVTIGSGLDYTGTTLSATATGGGTKTLARWTALDNHPPATNYASFDTRNSIGVLDFDDTTAESAVFVGIIPEAADFTTGMKVVLKWAATSATSGNVIWTAALERSTTDLDADSFATGVDFAASAANGTSGIVTSVSLDLNGTTEIDSIVAGDLFRLKITRKAADGSDTMTGDAELIAVEVQQR
jgi:hypothetical protein